MTTIHIIDSYKDYKHVVASADEPRYIIGGKRVSEYYSLTNLQPGSRCTVYPTTDGEWMRRTINNGAKGGTRYVCFRTLEAALKGGIEWARRKDREAARDAR